MTDQEVADIRQQVSISLSQPPEIVLDAIKVDGIVPPDEPVFTYDKVIYNPKAHPLPWHLYEHEVEHCVQQGNDPDGWWEKWKKDPAFRLDQEARGYGKQYRSIVDRVPDKNARAKALHILATQLSGEYYGKLTSHNHAKVLIQKHSAQHIVIV